MAEWPCCHDPLRFSPLSLRFDPPLNQSNVPPKNSINKNPENFKYIRKRCARFQIITWVKSLSHQDSRKERRNASRHYIDLDQIIKNQGKIFTLGWSCIPSVLSGRTRTVRTGPSVHENPTHTYWWADLIETDHGLSGLVPSVREKCPVRTARQSHVGQNHPRTAKTTRETKNSKINIFEENFLKGNIRNMSIKSLGCQVLIKSSFRHPLRPRQPEPCSMQKTWLEASENYEILPENSFNHPYEACKKSDSNSKYFFFYIKNTPGTESMSTGGRLKKSDLYI